MKLLYIALLANNSLFESKTIVTPMCHRLSCHPPPNCTTQLSSPVWCCHHVYSWWHHQMETFSMLQALCEGNPLVTGGFPSQGPGTQSFDVFFDLHLNKRLSIQSRRWWFEMPLHSLWHHCNVMQNNTGHHIIKMLIYTNLSVIDSLSPVSRSTHIFNKRKGLIGHRISHMTS